jgi:hypothetical protein
VRNTRLDYFKVRKRGLTVELSVILLIVALYVAGAVATALKGKPWSFLLGFVIGWFWVFGALRLAKPQSWWARHFYEGTKLAESNARFNKDGRGFEATPAPAFDPRRY